MHMYRVNIRHVKKYRGQTLRDAITNSGYKVSTVARRINKDPRTLYNWFRKDIGIDEMMLVASIIGKQYFEDVPEIRNAQINQTPEFLACVKEKEQLKGKIESLSDEILELHRENKQLIHKIATFEKQAYNSLNDPPSRFKKSKRAT